jgi:WD40 repeat protein
MSYDAFISYSHAADGRLAPKVQSGLHRFAKPLLRLRALHVFRDQTSLSATPELWSTIESALNEARFFVFSSDGSRFVTVSRDSIARIWDTQTGSLIHELFGHEGGVVGAAFSPDDTLVATVGDDYTRVWDVETGKQLGAYLGSYPEPIFFAHDCSKLVIGAGAGSEVRVHPFGACGSHDQLLAAAMEKTRLITESTRTLP